MSYAQSLGMIVTAYSPLGNGRSYAALGHSDVVAIDEDVVVEIGKRLNVTPAHRLFSVGEYKEVVLSFQSQQTRHE